jgi:hypothetical protein
LHSEIIFVDRSQRPRILNLPIVATFPMADAEPSPDVLPTVQEDLLQCLTAWPTGETALGGFYRDLFGPLSPDPAWPSPTATDPLLLLLSDLRSCLAHVAALRQSGAFAVAGPAFAIIDRSIGRFLDLYDRYNACLIQSWWRSLRPGATEAQKERLRKIRWGHPSRARSAEEEGQRRSLIAEIIAPPEDGAE